MSIKIELLALVDIYQLKIFSTLYFFHSKGMLVSQALTNRFQALLVPKEREVLLGFLG